MPVPQLRTGRAARRAAPGGLLAALLLCSAASAAPVVTNAAPARTPILLGAALATPQSIVLRSMVDEPSVAQAAPPLSVSVGYTYRGVALSGKTLDTSEWMAQGDVSRRVSLWYAYQRILAKGRLGHKRFETSGHRYGGQVALYGDSNAAKELTGSFEVFKAGQGKATAPNDFVTYVGTQTETVSLTLTTRAPRLDQTYLLTGSHVHGGTQSANVLGGGYGVDVPLGAKLRGSVNGLLLAQQGDGGASTHTVFEAGLSYRPVSWARLEAGAVVAPNGFAVAGSALTGLTSFLVYKPGGAAQELAGQRAGFGVLRLVLTHSF